MRPTARRRTISGGGSCAAITGRWRRFPLCPHPLVDHANNAVAISGLSRLQFDGQAAPGESSGDAMDRIEALAKDIPGTDVAWSGLSFQERLSSGQAPLLYGLSLLVIFLCLAALYESWTIPIAVLLVIPLGLVGAVFAVTLRG